MNFLSIISKHPAFMDKTLLSYEVDGERVIGVYGNEPYAVQVVNNSLERVEVRLSIDGTDVLTGEPASTEATGKRWVIESRDSAPARNLARDQPRRRSVPLHGLEGERRRPHPRRRTRRGRHRGGRVPRGLGARAVHEPDELPKGPRRLVRASRSLRGSYL